MLCLKLPSQQQGRIRSSWVHHVFPESHPTRSQYELSLRLCRVAWIWMWESASDAPPRSCDKAALARWNGRFLVQKFCPYAQQLSQFGMFVLSWQEIVQLASRDYTKAKLAPAVKPVKPHSIQCFWNKTTCIKMRCIWGPSRKHYCIKAGNWLREGGQRSCSSFFKFRGPFAKLLCFWFSVLTEIEK